MFCVRFVFCRLLKENGNYKVKIQSLEESTLWEDLDDVVMLNQVKEMTKLESKSD